MGQFVITLHEFIAIGAASKQPQVVYTIIFESKFHYSQHFVALYENESMFAQIGGVPLVFSSLFRVISTCFMVPYFPRRHKSALVYLRCLPIPKSNTTCWGQVSTWHILINKVAWASQWCALAEDLFYNTLQACCKKTWSSNKANLVWILLVELVSILRFAVESSFLWLF